MCSGIAASQFINDLESVQAHIKGQCNSGHQCYTMELTNGMHYLGQAFINRTTPAEQAFISSTVIPGHQVCCVPCDLHTVMDTQPCKLNGARSRTNFIQSVHFSFLAESFDSFNIVLSLSLPYMIVVLPTHELVSLVSSLYPAGVTRI